jgi:hypothetical protein
MKKIFFSAVMAVAAMGAANATDYVVYSGLDALGDGQVQIPVGNFDTWEGTASFTSVSGDTYNGRSYYEFAHTATGTWNGGGCMADLSAFDCSVLSNENVVLKFDARISNGNANDKWYVQLNAAGATVVEYNITPQLSSEWSEVSINLAEASPTLITALGNNPSSWFAFTLVGHDFASTGEAIQFTNVRYEVPDVAAPQLKVSVDVSDITYNSAVLKYNVTHKNLTGDLKVELLSNGEHVADLDADETSYTLTGLTEKTEYTYAVHAYSTADQLTTSEAITFTTKSENFEPKTFYKNYQGTVTKGGLTYFINSDCAITTTEEGAVNVRAKIVGGEDLINAYKFQVLHMNNGAVLHEQFMTLNKVEGTDNEYEGTTSFGGLEEGDALTNMQVYYEYAGGAFMNNYTGYHYGDTNENTFVLQPIITAYGVTDITTNSATINYAVANASEFDSYEVLLNGKTFDSSELVDLISGTTYNYVLSIKATKDGVEYTGNIADLTFTTVEEDAKSYTWYQRLTGSLPGAVVNGETTTVEYNVVVALTYYAGKITADVTADEVTASVKDLNLQFHESDHYLQSTTKSRAAGEYYYELTGTYTKDSATDFALLFAYPDHGITANITDYSVGAENENPVAGVNGIAADTAEAPVEYFNLQGVRVNGNLAPGVYIRRQGQSTSKILVK